MIALMALFLNARQDAAALDAKEIMRKQREIQRAKDESVNMKMLLINENGKTRERQVAFRTQRVDERNNKTLIQFLYPTDVKGTGFLTVEYNSQDDDRWLYLPALKKTRRISAAEKTDSFMGTQFAYEDFETEDVEGMSYRLLKEESLDGADCNVLEATPSSEELRRDSGYSKRELWVRKEALFTVRARYYDKKGNHLKTFQAFDAKAAQGAYWRADHVEMENHLTKEKTVLYYEKRVLDGGMSEDIFTRRTLERGVP